MRYDAAYGIRSFLAPVSRSAITYDLAYGIRKRPDDQLRQALLTAAAEKNPALNKLPSGAAEYGADIGGVLQWKPLLQEAERQFGVPWQVLGAIMAIESGGNAKARSPQGAVGLMQIMPNYHAGRAAKYGGDLWDPKVNIFTAADLLSELYRRYGSWDKAAAAYFGAIDASGNVTGARDAIGTSGYDYVDKFRNTLAKLQQLEQAGGKVVPGSGWSIFGGARFPITQEYANYNPSMYSSGYHTGIDIGAPSGTRLYSPFRGTVVQAGWNGGYGNSVTIKLDDGKVLILGHLSSVAVRPGQRVDAGAFLGLSGSTGYSTGPHVHVEMRDQSGKIIDPRNYLMF
ncbi:M23 family metallopeptidase [Thermomicrobium sp. 4228-Ro]|uniref:M23 family metallopeptidase n=1 Tax=Thermomicrobium sp. 4228-Ro TaxID=2993937 RepID=UPI0022493E3C|nr:M23 family metallopeptidase [Thermomicrobium sp. 4228-Ro]MCX2726001.1 M23 family metallopeptidase [Thermomicrobium sp. 4228-Ro]